MFKVRVEYPMDDCPYDAIPEDFDDVLVSIGKALCEIDNKNKFINIPKVKGVMDTENLLRKVVSKNAKVSHRLHEPWLSGGCVTIEGKEVMFLEPLALVEAASKADIVDMAPTLDGRVTIDFTFSNLTINPEVIKDGV